MNYNKQLIEYGNEFLKVFKEQFKDYISFEPLITFLVNVNSEKTEMRFDIKINNGNLENFKDIVIMKETEKFEKIQDTFKKRNGDYYTSAIFKNIEEFTKDEVEKDFKSICSFNFLRKESKEEIFFKTDYNNLSEEDKEFYNQAKELIEAGAIDDLEEFEKFSEEQKDNTIKTWALDLKKEQEEKNKEDEEEDCL